MDTNDLFGGTLNFFVSPPNQVTVTWSCVWVAAGSYLRQNYTQDCMLTPLFHFTVINLTQRPWRETESRNPGMVERWRKQRCLTWKVHGFCLLVAIRGKEKASILTCQGQVSYLSDQRGGQVTDRSRWVRGKKLCTPALETKAAHSF